VGLGATRKRGRATREWELRYRDESSHWHSVPVRAADELRVHDFHPVREPSRRKARMTPCGWFFSRTIERALPYESALERDVLLALDFEPDVLDLRSQPFYVRAADRAGEEEMCPDLIAEVRSERRLVIDVKPEGKLLDPDVEARLARMMEVCELAGWEHRVRCEPAPAYLRDLRFLRGAAAVSVPPQLRERILDRAGEGCRFSELTGPDDDACVMRPAALALIWEHRLGCDLTDPLSQSSWVWSTPRGEPK
jgi:hypothetical protein